MDIYKIHILPDPVLREIAQPVARVDDAVRAQMDKMVTTMAEAEGIGLAANQVGLLNRVIVVDTAKREFHESRPIAMANPEVIWKSEEVWTYPEGCLSIPQQFADVERPYEVRVKYLDRDGKAQEMHATGLTSTCLQHEIDHLNGVLFIDYISRLKRNMIIKKFDKLHRDSGNVL